MKRQAHIKLFLALLIFSWVYCGCLEILPAPFSVPEVHAAVGNAALSPIQETHIQENLATDNFGADSTFSLEGETGVRKRPLLLFDLSPIPAGATITSATLTLEKVGGDNTADTIDVHALSQSWLEGDSTPTSGADWGTFDGNNSWATTGGDFNPTVAASATISGPNGPKEWDVTGLVQDWFQGVQTNYGMLLKRQTETTGTIPLHIFSSREGSTDPKLTVYYTINSDIVIDCDFSDWTDGDGTELVIDDEGGIDDYATDRFDITRFGIAGNLSDTMYVLMGFDDLTFPSNRNSAAAALMDTDLDDNINYVISVTLRGTNTTVELYSCDDTLSTGCGSAVLEKTFTPSDFCRGTSAGPWNDDTFIELQFPYSDLGSFTGGDALVGSLVSYNGGFWNTPRDSIFGAPGTQDYDSRIQYDTDTGAGQVIPPAATAQNISGTVYGDEGTSPLGAGKTVRLLVNGANGGSDTTNGNGEYFIPAQINGGDAILVYIDNDVTFKGNSATVFGGVDLIDLDIYASHLISRHDSGGTLTNTALEQAKGSSPDDDILYSVSAGNLTVTGTDTELYLPSGHSYSPGGNVTTPNLESLGTFDSNGWTTLPAFQTFSFAALATNGQSIDGNKPAGTAAGDLLIAIMTTDGVGETLTAPGGWTPITANIGATHRSRSWYKIAGPSEPATYTFTVGTNEQITLGILRFSGQDAFNPINTSDTNIGTTTTPTAPDVTTTVNDTLILRYYGADDDDYTGDDTGYPGGHTGIYRRQSGGSNGECHQGAAYTTQAVAGPTGTAAFTKDNNEEWSAATIAIAPSINPATGTIDINGTLTIGGGSFTAPLVTWVSGDFVHSGGTFSHNSGSVVLDGSNQSISGNTTFYDFTKSVSTADTLTFEAGNAQRFSGTVTLQGVSGDLLNLRSSSPGARWGFRVNLAATKSISYVDVQDSNASPSHTTQKPIDPANSVDSGNTVDWFACDEMFSHLRQLTINGSRVSNTGLPADLTDFPVLISLSADWLKTIAADPVYGQIWHPQGFDIIFRAADGKTHLDHEIEHYDSSTGTLVAWVRIPLLSKSTDTNISMLYGNCGVTDDPQYSTEVWDPNHVAVWHLHDDFLDSTSNLHNGTNNGSVDQPGQIADGQEFPGTSEYIGIADSALINLMNVTTRSFSLWFKADRTSGVRQVIYEEGAGVNGFNIYLDSDTLYCGFWGTAITDQWMSTPFSDTTDWHHIGFDFDSTTGVQKMYLDGVEVDSRAEIGNVPTHTGDINIGRSEGISVYHDGANTSPYYFDGMIDELRISNNYLSKDWIITSLNNGDQPLRDTDCTDTGFICLGIDEFGPVTAINLLSFKATGQGGSVKVAWETAQEIDNKGFHLYRAPSPHGPFTRLTDKLIPGSRLSVKGSSYVYEDTDVTQGKLYYYKLEDNDIHGKSTWHGPICVDWDGDGMADDWEIAHGLNPRSDDSLLDLDGDGLTNLEEYELGTDPLNPDTDGDGIPDGEESRKRDPEAITVGRTLTQGVQIIESDAEGITLELRTDSFDFTIVEAEGQEYERLRITEYIHGFSDEVGKPELPMKGILLNIPEKKSATLTVLETDDQIQSGYRVYPVPEKAVDDQAQLAHVDEIFVIDEAAYSVDSSYPEVVAGLGETYVFRGQQKQQIVFSPLTYNPATGEIRHYRRIRVRLNYVAGDLAKAAGPEPTPWSPSVGDDGSQAFSSMVKMAFLTPSMIVNPIASVVSSAAILVRAIWAPPAAATPAYKILVIEDGIYRVTRSWLEAEPEFNGVDVAGIDLSQVRLYNLGQEIAIRVEDGGVVGQFDYGDFIEFYATPVESQYGKYASNNVYWLTTSGGSGAPKRMAEVDTSPGSATVAGIHSFTVHHEQDLWYMLSVPGGDSVDRWFFYPFVDGAGIEDGGAPVDFSLTLPGVAGQGSVKIWMVGYYDADHAVDVSVNGTFVKSFTWSGISFYLATIDGVDLLEGNNTISLTCTSGEDSFAVDWFEVTYPRSFAASGDLLEFSHEAGYRYQVTGFTDNDLGILDITSAAEVERLVNFQVSGSGPYSLEFEPVTDGERSYMALSSTAMKTPVSIAEDSPSSLADPANGADYILITHRDLGWDGSGDPLPWLSDLVTLRESQGLRVKVVDVEDIFDEFSYGIFTPQAVKDFLTQAYESWTRPAPQYVLFVGDSTYDAKGNWSWMLADATSTYLPTYLTATKYMGETMTDEWFARVSGDDAVPDLYIGRLPAVSAAEAAVMVNKVITYENALNDKSWEKNVLLVADDEQEDYEAVFELMNEDAASLLPGDINAPFRGYLDDYLVAGDLTAELKGKVDEGALVINYSGHGSTQIWANEHIFDTDDVADLANDEKLPFLVSMSCLTGYFGYPESWGFPSLGEAMLRSTGKGAVAALMPTGMTPTEGQHVLNTALFEAIFNEDIRTLGPAISAAKQTLLANGNSDYEEVSETFLLFGDPAMSLKVPLPTRPEGVVIEGDTSSLTVSWQEATDCNGNSVAGYNVYRSNSPGGSYEKVNDSLITGTQYADTPRLAGAASHARAAGGSGTTYYVVTSVDSDGDESVYSEEKSVTAGGGSPSGGGGGGGGCFINTSAGFGM